MASVMKMMLLLFLSLISFSSHFELREDMWDQTRPDVAALHRLSGLSQHLFHETLHRSRVQRSTDRLDLDPMWIRDRLKDCLDLRVSACVSQIHQDLDLYLDLLDQQKDSLDWLIDAAETSLAYSQKLLVAMDEDESTQDRVRLEHKADPRFSVIVSRRCLKDDSCVPRSDRHTVVKIFGRISADGRSVSGLSGSELADTMLQSTLETVPVFALDGKTSSDFEHDFLQTLQVAGSKAVVETQQDKQRTYQIMDQTQSVSGYRVPERPVDTSTRYDHQQILILQHDPTVFTAAMYLYEKHPAVSSLYTLDQNQRPILVYGESRPLTGDSRLVLVGHGTEDQSGETRLAGFGALDVVEIIGRTARVGTKIKTISVVGCEVGSSDEFVKTLAKEIHDTAGIEADLHLRSAVVQVQHTGRKITQEMSSEGLQWRHRDDSVKVVATRDRNGVVDVRRESGSRGEPVFTSERNVLTPAPGGPDGPGGPGGPDGPGGPGGPDGPHQRDWPTDPQRFLDLSEIQLEGVSDHRLLRTFDEVEALAWAFFHGDLPPPRTVDTENQEVTKTYVIGETVKEGHKKSIRWVEDEQGVRSVLSKCYDIASGEDVRKIIRHDAKTGEEEISYRMVKDWIYKVDPKSLYVSLIGKKLNEKERGNKAATEEIKKCITEQVGKESYSEMRSRMFPSNKDNKNNKNTDKNKNKNKNKNNKNNNKNLDKNIKNTDGPVETLNQRQTYAEFVASVFQGKRYGGLDPSTEAWFTTYFTASVLSESARNFRTFALVLLALDNVQSENIKIRQQGVEFLCDKHSMTFGGSWIDPSSLGFTGSASHKESSKKSAHWTEETLKASLKEVLVREFNFYSSWTQIRGNKVESRIEKIAKTFRVSDRSEAKIVGEFSRFKTEITRLDHRPASGGLGGHDDGAVTARDFTSASELEVSLRLEAYYSRSRTLSAQQIHNHIQELYGGEGAGLQLLGETARMEDGHFVVDTVSETPLRVPLSQETQYYQEQMLSGIDTAVHYPEVHGGAGSLEHASNAVGALGLMLGLRGVARAFEQGHVKEEVMGTLQTLHGATAMSASAIAKLTRSSETMVGRAASTALRSPAGKAALRAIPLAGMAFGVYNVAEDVKRGDALGAVDAVLDGTIVVLDFVELAQPELAPFIAPVTLALSVARMAVDDLYVGVQTELERLPPHAGVLQKVGAVFLGLAEGIANFEMHVINFFYDWRQEDLDQGRRLVEQISDYHQYYRVVDQGGRKTVDFSSAASAWNGGGIRFSLADRGPSRLCMDYFVSEDESLGKRCVDVDTQGSRDIVLGLGVSHGLEYQTLQKKVLVFIPAGSVKVVSGYRNISESAYGTYWGNRDSNRFFAIQEPEDGHVTRLMLSYYYRLFGEPGDDLFFLGPQKSFVRGAEGKDTYVIPKHGGKTTIDNYDAAKAQDTLHFSVMYRHISVSKSGQDVVFTYEGSHSVTVQRWFSGEPFRHMNIMSGDGVLFQVSSVVVSSVQLVAQEINLMFQTNGQTVNASQPLLSSARNILGSPHDDVLIGNNQKNLMDGGGGRDVLRGGEEEDVYVIRDRNQMSVRIENHSTDMKTDLAIVEVDLHSIQVQVEGDTVVLSTPRHPAPLQVTVARWFRSPADRHLLFVSKDLITFTLSDQKSDCLHRDARTSCIQSRSIDYSKSSTPLLTDLQEDPVLGGVTEVRGSEFNDVMRGNKEHNVFYPGGGDDLMEGRAGEDWYVISPGQGLKTINNRSPDLVTDTLLLKEPYQSVTSTCDGQSVVLHVNGRETVVLLNWFDSKSNQHLQVKTSDGVTAELSSDSSSCSSSLMSPTTVDYRHQKPEPLRSLQSRVQHDQDSVSPDCVWYRNEGLNHTLCGFQGKKMLMKDLESVKNLFGSSGFDIMVGNRKDNLLDPSFGGALMSGGEGKDTYIIRRGYGDDIMIDNFAGDGDTDTVSVQMDFLEGDRVELDRFGEDLLVRISTNGERLMFRLINFSVGSRHQHLQLQSSDGVHFKIKADSSAGDAPSFHTEAFKVTLRQSQVDCRLDLSSQRNLSTVHTVQGCPSKSNSILGNAQHNAVFGGWRDDVLEGGPGDDTLVGGQGDDVLIGGTGDDTLHGQDGNDTMMGNSGWDVFVPGPGADLVDGGPGRDTVLYRGDHDSGTGVYVNLLSGQGRHADAEGDVLKDVENVVGSIYPDVLVSGSDRSLLKGSDGGDVLVSTGGDHLVGGEGGDVYLLAFTHGSVTIDNCAKDNATDVLYLSSRWSPVFTCQLPPRPVLLTFYGPDRTQVHVSLKNWTGDGGGCGHLVVVCGQEAASVDRLLLECEQRQREGVWSLASVWTLVLVLLGLHGAATLHLLLLLLRRRRRKQTQPQRDDDQESVSLTAN